MESLDRSEPPGSDDALRESEERFRGAFDYSPIGMGLVTLDGRFLRVNPALCRIGGYEESELLGLMFHEIVPDEELESAVEAAVAELAAMSPRYLEIAKVSSNVWWNAVRDSYVTGLGMLVQAIGSEDMREGAQAFMEHRKPRFREARTTA